MTFPGRFCSVLVLSTLHLCTSALATDFTTSNTTGAFTNSNHRGQSLTPELQGDGIGDSGARTPVFLKDFSFNFTGGSPSTLHLYDSIPSLVDLSSGVGALASSTDNAGGTYTFDLIPLDRDTVYYALFAEDVGANYSPSGVYAGGERFVVLGGGLHGDSPGVGSDMEFEADFKRGNLFTAANATGGFSNDNHRGQSFTPSIQEDGVGSTGDREQVFLQSMSFEFGGGGNPNELYIYDSIPSLIDLNAGAGALYISESSLGGSYFFDFAVLDRDTVYYALFAEDVGAKYSPSGVYAGGERFVVLGGGLHGDSPGVGSDMEFEAEFLTVPEPSTFALAAFVLVALAACGWRRGKK